MKRFPIEHKKHYINLCKRRCSGDVLEMRFCDEEREPYKWWEKLLFLTRFRCGPNARFYKPL